MDAAWIHAQCHQYGISPTPLADVSRLTSSQKVAGVVCTVEKVISEGVGDVVVRVRDVGCALNCCFHSSVFIQYPMLAERDTVLLLKNVSVMCMRRSSIGATTTMLLCSLDNVVAIFSSKSKQNTGSDPRALRDQAPQHTSAHEQPESFDPSDTLIFGDNM
jgi:hypothetical protein